MTARIGVLVVALAALPALADRPPEPDMTTPFPHPRGYVCVRATSPITIDGKLDDAGWAAAPWSGVFVDIEGDKKPKPELRTRVKMLWDDEALYIAAELEEPHVWATLTKHDSVIFHDNDFEVFLDPDADNHLYGELELNALNTTWDLLLTKPYKDGGHAVNAWEITGLKTAVHVNGTPNDPKDKDVGWMVEIRWPFSGLQELSTVKVPPKDGEQWRINFSRVQWDMEITEGKYKKVPKREEHNWVWSPQGVIDMHRPERWGYLQFSTAAPGKAAFTPDVDWNTRDLLHRVYYAQRNYRKANGTYSATLAGLKFPDKKLPLDLQTTRQGYEISSVTPASPQHKPRRYSLTHDGRITVERN